MIWKSSKEMYPNLDWFKVSEEGDVLRQDGTITKGDCNGKFLHVMINDEFLLVSILICTIFHGKRLSDKHLVCHKDGNIFNNKASNLQWVRPVVIKTMATDETIELITKLSLF
uniref:HNH endonuclease n=1 Tax=Pithovirus LCPAC403 TaxID=2506596 RepID=A0A481ZCT5_9VIRU|nr:MAG: HNH endonuclease [Pithovirus LCPAC403]